MASRNFTGVQALEKAVKIIYGSITVGASGAVSASEGFVSAVKEATAGQYTLETDRYYKILSVSVINIDNAVPSFASASVLEDPASMQSDFRADGKFRIQLVDSAGAAIDATSGAQLMITMHMRNTSVSAGND
jgi:hypothetical protein